MAEGNRSCWGAQPTPECTRTWGEGGGATFADFLRGVLGDPPDPDGSELSSAMGGRERDGAAIEEERAGAGEREFITVTSLSMVLVCFSIYG